MAKSLHTLLKYGLVVDVEEEDDGIVGGAARTRDRFGLDGDGDAAVRAP